MFERWARWVYRRHGLVLGLSALFLLASALLLARGGELSHGTIHGIEADRGARLLERELRGPEAPGFTLVFHHPTLTVDDAEFQRAVREAVAPLRGEPEVQAVRTPFDAGLSTFLASAMQSLDGHRVVALVAFRPEATHATERVPALRERVRAGPLTVTVTGVMAFKSDLDRALQRDLIRAEVVSMPVALVVLVWVFGSLVAASLPAGVGGLAVVGGIALVMALSRRMEVAQYAINLCSLIGTAVAIDYSLFVVSRYREELAGGRSYEDALAVAVSTAGRAVAFSGLAVAIGLTGLMFFRGSYFASLGLGGTVVVSLSVVYALTFLPALLAWLGPRIDRWKVPVPRVLNTDGFWRKLASWVMRHPVLVLLPTLAVLLLSGRPFLDVRVAIPDVTVLPAGSEARRGHELLERHFADRAANRIIVAARFDGGPFANARRVGALYDLAQRLGSLPGVTRVEGVFESDPTLDRDGWVQTLTGPRAQWAEPLQVAAGELSGTSVLVLPVVTDAAPASAEARALVRRIRESRRVADGELLVTGQTAMDIDSTDFIRERVPKAVGFVVAMTVLVLAGLLGSVILPFKAVAMNLLSITASFGALVWIFQKGHLSRLLRFTPGPIEPSLPVILFCVVFGLSMDYEVLLLTRMQEEYERTGDNTHAVAEGLERSGRLITSAAAIMVVVFAAFSMAEVVLLKAIGIGMVIAVALDATLVRVLVVPATMRLFGDLNWWAPAWLKKVKKRVGRH